MGKPMNRNWRLIYANWQASGLSKSVYCREHNISINRFRYYAVQFESQQFFAGNSTEQGMASPQFAEIVCRDDARLAAPPQTPLILRLTCGSTIELSAGFDADVLKQVLEIARQL